MANGTMTTAQAIEALKNVAKAKQAGTSKPDAELAKIVEEAAKTIKAAQTSFEETVQKSREDYEALTKRSDKPNKDMPIFKSGFTDVGGRRLGGLTYETLIKRRAREGDVWLQKFHRWNDDVMLAAAMMSASRGERVSPREVLKRIPDLSSFLEDELGKSSSELEKAMAAATATQGAEWIPEFYSPELIDMIRVERVLGTAFRRRNMRAGIEKLSNLTNDMVTYVITESTGNTPYTVPANTISDLGTARVTLEAVELIAAGIASKTFEEDSIIDAIPEMREGLVRAMAEAQEDGTVNGSEEGTHPDSDVSGPVASTAWNGLRATAQGQDFTTTTRTVAMDGTNMTVDNLLKLTLLQGRFGKPGDNIYVTSPQGHVKLLGLRDAGSNQVLITLDKIGNKAALLSGAVGELFGSSVVISDLVKTNLNSAGIVPATPEDRTQLLRVNHRAFIYGDRRMLTVEQDVLPLTRQRVLVATERMIFKRVKPAKDALKDFPVTIGLNIETV